MRRSAGYCVLFIYIYLYLNLDNLTISYIYAHLSNHLPTEDGDLLRGGGLHLGWYRPGGAERAAQDDRRRHHRGRAHRRAPRPGQPLQQVPDISIMYRYYLHLYL